ncbi:HIT family hydrolase [Candidatus Saccharibacteria bacterium]|nr:HIT family hydrolase [Candidatus Saccharibacteria bacterium]
MRTETDFLGNEMTFDCMGCDITSGKLMVPGGVIYRGDIAVLAADPEVPIPGFLVVNVSRHIRSLSELNSAERHEVVDVAAAAERALKSLGISEVTLVQEERSSHFHIWVFPNYNWMTEQFGKGVSYLRDIMHYADDRADDATRQEVLATIEKVRDYFKEHGIVE